MTGRVWDAGFIRKQIHGKSLVGLGIVIIPWCPLVQSTGLNEVKGNWTEGTKTSGTLVVPKAGKGLWNGGFLYPLVAGLPARPQAAFGFMVKPNMRHHIAGRHPVLWGEPYRHSERCTEPSEAGQHANSLPDQVRSRGTIWQGVLRHPSL